MILKGSGGWYCHLSVSVCKVWLLLRRTPCFCQRTHALIKGSEIRKRHFPGRQLGSALARHLLRQVIHALVRPGSETETWRSTLLVRWQRGDVPIRSPSAGQLPKAYNRELKVHAVKCVCEIGLWSEAVNSLLLFTRFITWSNEVAAH